MSGIKMVLSHWLWQSCLSTSYSAWYVVMVTGAYDRLIEKREKETEGSHIVTITVAEVYNEQIRDLLALPRQQVYNQMIRISLHLALLKSYS